MQKDATMEAAQSAGLGKVSLMQEAASSLRTTLRGDAGWHRADFAEARTLDDGRRLMAVDQMRKIRPPSVGGRSVHVVSDFAELGANIFQRRFIFF